MQRGVAEQRGRAEFWGVDEETGGLCCTPTHRGSSFAPIARCTAGECSWSGREFAVAASVHALLASTLVFLASQAPPPPARSRIPSQRLSVQLFPLTVACRRPPMLHAYLDGGGMEEVVRRRRGRGARESRDRKVGQVGSPDDVGCRRSMVIALPSLVSRYWRGRSGSGRREGDAETFTAPYPSFPCPFQPTAPSTAPSCAAPPCNVKPKAVSSRSTPEEANRESSTPLPLDLFLQLANQPRLVIEAQVARRKRRSLSRKSSQLRAERCGLSEASG